MSQQLAVREFRVVEKKMFRTKYYELRLAYVGRPL